MMDDVYIYHTHTFFGLFLFCVGTHIYSLTSQDHELMKRALESNDDLGSRGLSFPPFPLAQGLHASLLLGSHTAMGYLPLVTLCPHYCVHFACYSCFYAFTMQLWPLLAYTHASPLWYSYVYLHAWWRYLLLLPCFPCATCYCWFLCWESHDITLLFTYGLSSIRWW